MSIYQVTLPLQTHVKCEVTIDVPENEPERAIEIAQSWFAEEPEEYLQVESIIGNLSDSRAAIEDFTFSHDPDRDIEATRRK